MDESGDLGKNNASSPYFIFSAIVASDPNFVRFLPSEKVRYPERKEVKAQTSNRATKEYVLTKLSQASCDIYAIAVPKDKIFNKYGRGLAQDRFYHFLCGLLLKQIGRKEDMIDVEVDERHTKNLLKKNFRNYIEKNFLREGQKLRFHQLPSTNDDGLFAVDFVAWSVNRKFNLNDDSYLNIIKDKIKNFDTMERWKEPLPSRKVGNNFKGVIIEESLDDKSILKRIKIVKTKTEKVPDRYKIPWLQRWTKDIVEIPENEAEEIAEEIKKSMNKDYDWHVFFFNKTAEKTVHFTINKDKVNRTERPAKERSNVATK